MRYKNARYNDINVKNDDAGSENVGSYDFTVILKCHTPGRFSGSNSEGKSYEWSSLAISTRNFPTHSRVWSKIRDGKDDIQHNKYNDALGKVGLIQRDCASSETVPVNLVR